MALSQEQAQIICDKWTDTIRIGSWKFVVELKDSGNIQFRYNCQNGTVALEITYAEATEKRIVSMLTDFALLHRLLPMLIEGGNQYLDHDDRNIKEIVGALLTLATDKEEANHE